MMMTMMTMLQLLLLLLMMMLIIIMDVVTVLYWRVALKYFVCLNLSKRVIKDLRTD